LVNSSRSFYSDWADWRVDVVIDIPETLLLEVHRAIETAAKEAVLKIGRPVSSPALSDAASPLERSVAAARASLVVYPPIDYSTGAQLSSAETAAIVGMSLSSDARSGLEKLVADAVAAAFFRFFCLLDGVADPQVREVDDWFGAVLAAPPDGDRPMLHDELFGSYWRYRETSRPTP
jgi:hypothetical protein